MSLLSCPVCGNPKPRKDRKTCSKECGYELKARRIREGRVTSVCEKCGGSFSVAPAIAKRQRFCSRKCSGTGYSPKGRTVTPCIECGKSIQHSAHVSRKYCSKACTIDALAKSNRRVASTSCLWCNTTFEYPPYKMRKYCSRACAAAYGRTQTTSAPRRLKGLTKRVSCISCERRVTVPKSTANSRVLCTQHRADRDVWLQNIRDLRACLTNEQALLPYSFHIVRAIDTTSAPWNIVLYHRGHKKELVLPLVQYLAEAKYGRFLKDTEEVFFLDGNPENRSVPNIAVRQFTGDTV